MFKCSCSICRRNSKSLIVYWKKVNNISEDNIKWKQISWFTSIGFINSKLTYMKYIWGLKYKRVYNNTELAKDIPFSFLLLCKLLRILDNIKNEIIYKNNIK